MARKVFISFLGFNNYEACHYCKDGFKSLLGRYVQEATLDYLQSLESWTQEDAAYILLTDGAYKKNWLDDGHKDRDTHEIIRQPGLNSILTARNYPFTICPVEHLPDGNNEAEIFEIFSRVFDLLQDGDRLYFDITHGFRYLPMLVLVLQNYAKFLKGIKVEAITYGNFEARNKETKEAQIIDLLPLSNIQDWTFAAADYLENGNAGKIKELATAYSRPILKETRGQDQDAKVIRSIAENLNELTLDLQLCRGMNIINADNVKKLNSDIEGLEKTIIQPLNPLISKIKEGFSDFSSERNIMNGFCAARWCMNNGLYQQAATILEETVVSFFSEKHGIDLVDSGCRDYVGKAFCYWNLKNKELFIWPRDRELQKRLIDDEQISNKQFYVNYNRLSELRNDINHNGMRDKRLKSSALIIKLEECIDKFAMLLHVDNNDLL